MRLHGFAFAVWCVVGCAGPPVPRAALDGWQTAESHGVRIVSDAEPAEVDAFARDLAGFHSVFSFLIGRELSPAGPTTIALIRDPELARRFGFGGGTSGFAWSSLDGSFAFVLVERRPVETRTVLFHEYTHLLLWRNRRALIPRWYTEGLADYFSTVAFRDGAVVVGSVPPHRLGWLVHRRQPMPLALLFGGDRERTLRGRARYDFYATAWGLTHYLLSSPKGRAELSRFERELAKGTSLDAAREAAFGRPFERLTEELTTHAGYLARGVAAESVLDPRQVHVLEPGPAAPMRRSEVAGALGALALALAEPSDDDEGDYSALARSLLEIAVDEDPASSRFRTGLARARSLDGDLRGGEEILASALRDAPSDPLVQIDAGRVALVAERADEAQASFRRALALEGGSAAAWFGLGRALASAGEAEPARDALEHARSLGWSGEIDLELGRLHARAQRTEQARALLQPLASDPHGGSVSEQAAELLNELDASSGADRAARAVE
jgi:tetratricopeptide (TPR) repeat protein